MKTRKIITIGHAKSLLDEGENFLHRSDIKIIPVSSNEEALDIHKTEKADLIIADIDGQNMNGERLCSTIRGDRDLCKVSLIIVHSGDIDESRVSGCRANAFIDKSSEPAKLLEETRRLMSIPVRETYRAPILVKVKYSRKKKPSVGYSENISSTGMLFDAEEEISKGEIILCSFILPEEWKIRTEAEVVRHVDRGAEHSVNQYGIRFLDLADKHRVAIEMYIRNRQRKP